MKGLMTMPQLYISTVKAYKAPKTLSDGTQFLPFTNKTHIKIVKDAIRIIDTKIKNNKLCNSYFKALPLKKGFLQIWKDKNIWISYDGSKGAWYATNFKKKNISLTNITLNRGRWTTAATIIHELAHSNGAPSTTRQAEDALLKCMLKVHHTGVIGQIKKSSRKVYA